MQDPLFLCLRPINNHREYTSLIHNVHRNSKQRHSTYIMDCPSIKSMHLSYTCNINFNKYTTNHIVMCTHLSGIVYSYIQNTKQQKKMKYM